MNTGIWGWDEAVILGNSQWRKIHVNATGDLQVDVLSSELPADAATETTLALVESAVDGIEGALGQCYGWVGDVWYHLLVESAANPNLRVKLYDGANGIGSELLSAGAVANTLRGLVVNAALVLSYGAEISWSTWRAGSGVTDASTGSHMGGVTISGWNGARWDRLRCGAPADALATSGFALDTRCFLMGYDGADWNMVRVDAAGHLQVDILTAPTTDVQCHGWDGDTWEKMLFESTTLHNLRVKLYDGANGIDSIVIPADLTTERGLVTASLLYGNYIAGQQKAIKADQGSSDNRPTSYWGLQVNSRLYGYDGATWDRLRTYGVGILKVGKGDIGVTLTRETGTGSVVAGAVLLHQMCVNPSAASAVLEISDATIAAQPIAWDMFFTARETHHFVFDPPIPFATGIYIETLTAITSVMLCYTT